VVIWFDSEAGMALMLGQLYEALRAGNVPDDKARAASEEVANYEGEIGRLRLDVGEVKADVRLLKWMMGFPIAVVLGVFAIQWQILLRLPS
jgi:hypothetical protein